MAVVMGDVDMVRALGLAGIESALFGIPDATARQSLIARFDLDATVPEWALAYRFDMALGGRAGEEP